MHNAARRMDLQIPAASKALSRDGEVAVTLVGILIERSDGLSADNLRSYVRDSDPFSIGKKAVEQRAYHVIIRRLKAKSTKQLCTKKQRCC
jgi:hypothetical protein